MKKKILVFFLFLAYSLCLQVLYSTEAQGGRAFLDTGVGFKTGDFGTPTRSDLFYFSPTMGYIDQKYDLSVSMPFLAQRNRTGSLSDTEGGIGDLIVRGGFWLIPERGNGLSLSSALAVKIPLADEEKGLGTGETDYGAFFTAGHRFNTIKFYASMGYIVRGDSSFEDYNDTFLYGLGISKDFGRTNCYISLDGRQSFIDNLDDPLELSIGFFHALNYNYSIRGSAFFGLNDGGPDIGLDFGIVRWF